MSWRSAGWNRTPADLAQCVAALEASSAADRLFDRTRELTVARAPGRLDVMGGIADYSGAAVLEWPLAEGTYAVAQRSDDGLVEIHSGATDTSPARDFRIALDELLQAPEAAFDGARWAAYAIGALPILHREHDLTSTGCRVWVHSTVPEAQGVSSSAALEVAAMSVLAAIHGIRLEPRELALLCQQVETTMAGAPCGVMDQMTASCGIAGELCSLLCQPAELRPGIPLPPGLALFGIDSGERHAIADGHYAVVRVAAFMGRRILEQLTGVALDHLVNVDPEAFATLAGQLPERLSGADFLSDFGGTADPVTRVVAEGVYPVAAATTHPVREHARAHRLGELLAAPPATTTAEEAGQLLLESHASVARCGLDSPGTNRLVELARGASADGVFGAKITGGGGGGVVALLARDDAEATVRDLATAYRRDTGRGGRVLRGSSHGCAEAGIGQLHPEAKLP